MFLIFGTRGRWSQHRHDTGEFFCPTCGGDRQWVRSVLRRWFTVFFVPLFPIGRAGRQRVQCTTCSTRFDEDVLGQPTANVLTAELQGTMRIAATEVVRAAGPSVAGAAIDAVRSVGVAVYDDTSLRHDLDQIDPATLAPHLAYLGGALALQGREQLLTTLTGVARSGGETSMAAAVPLLQRIGQGLAMSPAHVTGVLAGQAPAVPPPPPTGWAAPKPPAQPPDRG